MSIINKFVEVRLNNRYIQYWKDKGYEIPLQKDKWNRLSVAKGTKIKVKVDDLSTKSNVKVLCKCDNCGKERYLKFEDYKDLCKECSLRTEENRKKMSQKMKGRYIGNKNPFYDKKHKASSIQKIKDNMPSFEKKNNPNWNPNLNEEYRRISKDRTLISNYKFVMKKAKERDGCCIICGATKNLHAHHILDFKNYPEFRTDINNIVTLCYKHHISKNFHSLHKIYGKYPTKEQLKQYIKENKNGQIS